MNLSCAKCRVVRSFSGDPLTCEVCGWVCEPIDPNQASDTEYWQHLRKLRQTPLADTEISSFPTEPNRSVNISCADCNAIRPFSGGPPNWKCEVCGWELGTPSRKPRPTPSKDFQGCLGSLGTILGLGFMIAVALLGLWGLIALVKWFWYHS
jgi:rubredoxin